jgi:putative hydrolase of the HAD superfamily
MYGPTPEMQRYEALVFDLGGVLISLGGVTSMRAWMRETIAEETLWLRWLHSPTVRAFELGAISPEDFARGVCREFSLHVGEAAFLDAFPRFIDAPYEGARTLLDALAPRYTLASLSNTNVVHWDRVRGEMDFARHFHHNFPSHETRRIKPDPEAFEQVIAALGCAPRKILFLDDNQPNVDAAIRAGMDARRTVGLDEARRVLDELGIIPAETGVQAP